MRPGAPAGIGLAGAGAFTINFFFPGKCYYQLSSRQCHMPYGMGTAESRALERV